MEDKLRSLHGKNIEFETQLQLETRARRYVEDYGLVAYNYQHSWLLFHQIPRG